MTESSTTATEPDHTPAGSPSAPGERRLARPPSDRYRATEVVDSSPRRPTSAARGLLSAALVGAIGAVVITILGGVLTLTGGLLMAAGLIGWAVGRGVRFGAGDSLSRGRRIGAAIALALAAVIAGQVGLWLYAGTEGGVLTLTDYLGQTFGPLVPVEAIIAMAAAAVAAR